MSTNYPTSLDTTSNLPPIAATDLEDAAGKEHDVQHSNLNAAVIAIETKLGIDATPDATSIDGRLTDTIGRLMLTDSRIDALVGKFAMIPTSSSGSFDALQTYLTAQVFGG